ncbi:MAG: LicD family protein [Paludibacteraceae bacterium]|nr:LicD family protein [Paludibacteraceae bacterium]
MYDKDRYIDILLRTLKTFDAFCSRYNLKYVAAFGTVLGAIRHKGLIPWDDDIDVYMLRPDYERFLTLRKEAQNENCKIQDISDEGYYLPYAKFSDANTSIWEIKEFECMIGVFIDVFPLDFVSEDVAYCQQLQENYRNLIYKYQISLSKYTLFNVQPFATPMKLVKAKMRGKSYFRRRINDIENDIKAVKGDKVFVYESFYSLPRCAAPLEWFENPVRVPFEGWSIPVPRDYDGFLTLYYGDYMTPPPVEKRVSQHYHYFVDLDRYVSVEEVKNLKK